MSTTTAINTDAERRILVMDEQAKKAGFADVQPWFAVGTRLVEVGQDKFRQSREKYENMPTVEEALPLFIEAIQNEKRVDVDVKPEQLHMLSDGRLEVKSKLLTEPLQLTPTAFKQMARWLTDPRKIANPGAYFSDIDPERRAQYVNDEIALSTQPFKLRTRTPNGHTEVYAVTGTRYTPVDADAIAYTILKNSNPSTKVQTLYQGTRSKIDLVYHADLAPKDVGVGEYYKASQTFRSNDDGTSAVTGGSSLFRAICINLTTVELAIDVLRRRHSGEQEAILAMLVKALEVSYEKIRWFVDLVNHKAKSEWDVRGLIKDATGDKYPYDTPKNIFEHLFDKEHKAWAIPSLSADQVAKAAEDAWFTEKPDWSVVGLSNALSRSAHEGAWRDLSFEQIIQDRAGQLVMAASVPWGFTEEEEHEGE